MLKTPNTLGGEGLSDNMKRDLSYVERLKAAGDRLLDILLNVFKPVFIFFALFMLGSIILIVIDKLVDSSWYSDLPLWGRWLAGFVTGAVAFGIWKEATDQ